MGRRLLLIPAMRCTRCGDDHCALPEASGLCWRCHVHRASSRARERAQQAVRWDRHLDKRYDEIMGDDA